MVVREALHYHDKGHLDVHGQELCAKAQVIERGESADELVQALHRAESADKVEAHLEDNRRDQERARRRHCGHSIVEVVDSDVG